MPGFEGAIGGHQRSAKQIEVADRVERLVHSELVGLTRKSGSCVNRKITDSAKPSDK